MPTPTPAKKSNPPIFKQDDFGGGLNCKLDAAKTPDNGYPLLISGRTRRNVISPVNKHLEINAPTGNYQGLYIAGSFVLLFVSGIAYYADATTNPIIFHPVSTWVPMDSSVARIYAEMAPATSNLFNRQGSPDLSNRIFNNALSIFESAIYCFDGLNSPQAVLPNGSAAPLGSFATWTKDAPLYVPVGVLPTFASNKLFVVSPDYERILSSVSGRCSDFVINLDSLGDKGGDADTMSQTVSLNSITALRGISTGEVLVGTLYGTHIIELDNTNTIFGEPFLRPRFIFPAGPVNELSIVDILSDTAMITQSGIHAFNAVAQAKRESNNFPLGAQIRGLLTNPITEKAIIQADTCAIVYDDYAFFAVNTIHGYGALVYDTTTQSFQSLDLSFGRVKQFASTRISGIEKLLYITHDNRIFEAFAGSTKATTQVLLGEWTPDEAPAQVLSYMIDTVFANVRTSGQLKISIYGDRVLQDSVVLEVTADEKAVNLPISIPFVEGQKVVGAGFHFNHTRCWKLAAMLEWNFAGDLTDVSIDGKIETADNVSLALPNVASSEDLVFYGSSSFNDELNPGGTFPADDYVIIPVVKGALYIYFANGNGSLVNGSQVIDNGIFAAAQNTVAIRGAGSIKFSLKTITNQLAVIDAVNREKNIKAIIHGGNFSMDGSLLYTQMAKSLINRAFYPVAGEDDVINSAGLYFFNTLNIPRHYTKAFEFTDFFFFNSSGVEPDGTNNLSVQAGLVRNWVKSSTKPFKFVVTNKSPYTDEVTNTDGESTLRYLLTIPGISAILGGQNRCMERFVIDGFPVFNCGTGGQTLSTFLPAQNSAFRDNTHYGFLRIHADAISCKLSFTDVNNAVLDPYALHS